MSPPTGPGIPSQKSDNDIFSIPEILTLILTFLSPHDLLLSAQRVNHQWAVTIKESLALQQRLWFRSPTKLQPQAKETFNPFLLNTFPHFYSVDSTFDLPRYPWFTPQFQSSPHRETSAFNFKDATWRLMYPSTNSYATLKLIKGTGWRRGGRIESAILKREQGWRMGALFDVVEQETEKLVGDRTSVNWMLEWGGADDEVGTRPSKGELVLRIIVEIGCMEGRYKSPKDGFLSEGRKEIVVEWKPYSHPVQWNV